MYVVGDWVEGNVGNLSFWWLCVLGHCDWISGTPGGRPSLSLWYLWSACCLSFPLWKCCSGCWFQECDWRQHPSTGGIREPYFLGGLSIWYPLRSLKPPIERRPCCRCISWYESMPLEFQCQWHNVSVNGVILRTRWWPWFWSHRNLRRFFFYGLIIMQ